MSPDAPSHVRVFVHWRDQTVFAGEDVQCTITFKNVAPEPQEQKQQSSRKPAPTLVSPLHGRAKAATSLTSPPPPAGSIRGHRRSALSLSVPAPDSRSRSGSIQWPHTPSSGDWRPGHAHKRSVSIVSIGSASATDDHGARNDGGAKPQRPHRGHGRAASLQILPRAQSTASGPQSGNAIPA